MPRNKRKRKIRWDDSCYCHSYQDVYRRGYRASNEYPVSGTAATMTTDSLRDAQTTRVRDSDASLWDSGMSRVSDRTHDSDVTREHMHSSRIEKPGQTTVDRLSFGKYMGMFCCF